MGTGKMRLFSIVAAFGGLCVLGGCGGGGWAPGPRMQQGPTEITLPGNDKPLFRVADENARTVVVRGMVGDGKHWPSIEELTWTSDPSVALVARSSGQVAGIEAATNQIERAADKLASVAERMALAIAPLRAAEPAPPAGASRAAITQSILTILSDTTLTSDQRLQAIAAALGGGASPPAQPAGGG